MWSVKTSALPIHAVQHVLAEALVGDCPGESSGIGTTQKDAPQLTDTAAGRNCQLMSPQRVDSTLHWIAKQRGPSSRVGLPSRSSLPSGRHPMVLLRCRVPTNRVREIGRLVPNRELGLALCIQRGRVPGLCQNGLTLPAICAQSHTSRRLPLPKSRSIERMCMSTTPEVA